MENRPDYFYAEACYKGLTLTNTLWVLKTLPDLEKETVKQFKPDVLGAPIEAVKFYYDLSDFYNSKPWKIHTV